jgi:hypothetical protein
VISINYINNSVKTRKLLGIAGAFLVLVFPYIIASYQSAEYIESQQSLCPFKMLTGFPCPGCGITKSLVFLYEGNIFKSLYYHLFGPLAFIFCILVIVVLSFELTSGRECLRNIFFNLKLAYFIGSSLAMYHFIRIIYFISTNSLEEILQQSVWK